MAAFRQTLVKLTLCERWWSVEWRIERPRGQRANLTNQTLYERCRVGLVTLEWPRAQADGVFEREAERE